MKLRTIISVLFIVPLWTTNISIAQTIKTYTGPLKKPDSMIISSIDNEQIINATYQYYEDNDGARVWHGSFYYTSRIDILLKSFIKVSGRYEHGKQTGQWIETVEKNGKPERILKYNLKSGKLNGAYTFQNFGGVSINASFNENKLTNTLTLTFDSDFSLKGQFDEQGLASGEWVMQYKSRGGIPHIRRYTYDHGVAMRIIDLDNSTGIKTVLREAIKSDYGTIVIDDQHYKVVNANKLSSNNNEIQFDVLISITDRNYDGLLEFLDEWMPLYLYYNKPIVGLERTEDPSQTKEEVFLATEIMPMFQGGDLNNFRSWVQQNLQHPVDDNGNRITGGACRLHIYY